MPPTSSAAAPFAAIWFGLVVASVVGNYPTPFFGYGSSPIVGYMLAAAALDPRG